MTANRLYCSQTRSEPPSAAMADEHILATRQVLGTPLPITGVEPDAEVVRLNHLNG